MYVRSRGRVLQEEARFALGLAFLDTEKPEWKFTNGALSKVQSDEKREMEEIKRKTQ